MSMRASTGALSGVLCAGLSVGGAFGQCFEQVDILPSEVDANDRFGVSAAVDGVWLAVGADMSDDSGAADAGAVFMFNSRASLSWILDGQLFASDRDRFDSFGFAVDVDGTRLVVGAFGNDDDGDNSGAAYVFEFNGSDWVETAKLTASDGSPFALFGTDVGVSGDRIVVGALGDDAVGSDSGSAYVFSYNGVSWSQEQKLLSNDLAAGDGFGGSVGISGDRIIVGAADETSVATDNGAAYVFRRSGSTWVQEQKLTAFDAAGLDEYGTAVAIDGTRAIVGSKFDDDNGGDSGSAYVYLRNGTVWNLEQKLTAPDGEIGDNFGNSVDVDGIRVIVGADVEDDSAPNGGSAYVFQVNGGGFWNFTAKLRATDPESFANFGHSVAIDGAIAFAGADRRDANGADSGKMYVHDLTAALSLSSTGNCPGQITLTASGATPATDVYFIYSFNAGSAPVPGCPSTTVDIAAPNVGAIVAADGSGNAAVQANLPANACGQLIVQAVGLDTCCVSNTINF